MARLLSTLRRLCAADRIQLLARWPGSDAGPLAFQTAPERRPFLPGSRASPQQQFPQGDPLFFTLPQGYDNPGFALVKGSGVMRSWTGEQVERPAPSVRELEGSRAIAIATGIPQGDPRFSRYRRGTTVPVRPAEHFCGRAAWSATAIPEGVPLIFTLPQGYDNPWVWPGHGRGPEGCGGRNWRMSRAACARGAGIRAAGWRPPAAKVAARRRSRAILS